MWWNQLFQQHLFNTDHQYIYYLNKGLLKSRSWIYCNSINWFNLSPLSNLFNQHKLVESDINYLMQLVLFQHAIISPVFHLQLQVCWQFESPTLMNICPVKRHWVANMKKSGQIIIYLLFRNSLVRDWNIKIYLSYCVLKFQHISISRKYLFEVQQKLTSLFYEILWFHHHINS